MTPSAHSRRSRTSSRRPCARIWRSCRGRASAQARALRTTAPPAVVESASTHRRVEVVRVPGAGHLMHAVQTVEVDELRPEEVLVKVAAAGICHTDLIVRDQWYPVPLPAVLGHEGAGVVERVGANVAKVAAGDRVGMSFDSCGACPKCTTGRPMYCDDFFARNFGASRPDGTTALSRGDQSIHSHFFGQSSFATYAVATERNVVKLSEDVPLEVVRLSGAASR